jgi:hypothetical protein
MCLLFSIHPREYNSICFYYLCTIDPWEYSFISLFFPYTQGNTASFVCYFHTHRAIQLHIFAIVHTHSASFVCYLPNNQDNMVQLHLFVIVYTHRGIELDLSVIVYAPRGIQLHLFVTVYTPRGIQLHLSVIFNTPSVIQLHLFAIFHTPMGIQLYLFLIFHTHSIMQLLFVCYCPCTQGNTVSFFCLFSVCFVFYFII